LPYLPTAREFEKFIYCIRCGLCGNESTVVVAASTLSNLAVGRQICKSQQAYITWRVYGNVELFSCKEIFVWILLLPKAAHMLHILCWQKHSPYFCWDLQEFCETFCKLPLDEGQPDVKLFWTLFLVAKLRLLPTFPDWVTAFSLLIAVFNLFLAHLDPQHRRVDPKNLEYFPERTSSGQADLLKSLVKRKNADLAMVSAVFSLEKAMELAKQYEFTGKSGGGKMQLRNK
jgi:hypothetical protein